MTDDWPNVCVLCAAHDRQTRLKYGHCCAKCADRLVADVRAVLDLCVMACTEPSRGSGGHSTAYGSKPPLVIDGLDPELALTGPPPAPTVLDVMESWTRMVRELREMAPYGPWTAHTATELAGTADGTRATLTACTTFLAAQVPWMVGEPGFPLEDFAGEVAGCVRVLRRWDVDAEERGQMVPCPTMVDKVCPDCAGAGCQECTDGVAAVECGYRIGFRVHMDDQVTCRRCGVTRDVPQLLMAANADNALVDAEALAGRFAIDTSTIRKWARLGKVERQGQRYRYGDVRVLVADMRGRHAG